MSSQRRYFLFIPLFLCACALLGGLLGPGTRSVSAAQEDNSPASDESVKASLQAFTKVYDIVDENAAEKLSADKAIYKGAIPGMLRTLDPHSNFLDAKDFAGLREEQHGKYYGIGMLIGDGAGVRAPREFTSSVTSYGGDRSKYRTAFDDTSKV